jgi:hypothetical protein
VAEVHCVRHIPPIRGKFMRPNMAKSTVHDKVLH